MDDGTPMSDAAANLPRVTDVLLVPLKEAFLFGAWLRANFTSSVQWRNNSKIVVGEGSKVQVETDQLPPDAKQMPVTVPVAAMEMEKR